MKVIIQCSGSKNRSELSWNGNIVYFVARPEFFPSQAGHLYVNPDDQMPGTSRRWRDLIAHQDIMKENGLSMAIRLYKPKIYRQILSAFGAENCFILSAGWGLVRGDFLLPAYDITFSPQADKGKRRRKQDVYDDFNHLARLGCTEEKIVVFAGLSYLPMLNDLLRHHTGPKHVYFKSANFVKQPGYNYEYFETNCVTNWHYQAAKEFIQNTTGQIRENNDR